MIWFVVLGLILTALVVLGLLFPLLRRAHGPGSEGDPATAAYRAKLAELEQDHAEGHLSREELREAIDELERELLAARAAEQPPVAPPEARSSRATAVAVALAVPVCAVLLYAVSGHPRLAGESLGGGLGAQRIQQLQNMAPTARIDALEEWLNRNPDSARGWSLLAQAYRETSAYGDAANAFGRARMAGANDAWLIARQAESLLLANDRRFTRGVWRLLDEALDRDARNGLALMLAGQGAFVSGDMESAASYWRRLAEALPEGDSQRAMIEQLVARAESAAEGHAESGVDGAAGAPGTGGTGSATASGGEDGATGPRLNVRVSLADDLGAQAQPNDTVFVFARSPEGGGPPRAVARTRVAALPASVTLTDANAMAPQFRLSGADEVIVTARVSRSGQAQAQSGDLEGSSDPVAVDGSSAVRVVIDRRVP